METNFTTKPIKKGLLAKAKPYFGVTVLVSIIAIFLVTPFITGNSKGKEANKQERLETEYQNSIQKFELQKREICSIVTQLINEKIKNELTKESTDYAEIDRLSDKAKRAIDCSSFLE